ncbi:MAG: dihydrolipoyllysine-residue acetyltransferase [Gammaproteobacteria bacterium]|nr:dihydrolipoyllysine-residue acetyltransferase [Gammaproteobacteria bacterium]
MKAPSRSPKLTTPSSNTASTSTNPTRSTRRKDQDMAEIKNILVPDIGDFSGVEVIEILVSEGDAVNVEDTLVSLESDKAAMEIPSEYAGVIKEIKINMGDTVSQGDVLMTIEVADEAAEPAGGEEEKAAPELAKAEPAPKAEEPKAEEPQAEAPAPAAAKPAPVPQKASVEPFDEAGFRKAHASPGVRKFARELGANLARINGSGEKGRILKEDVKAFVKQALSNGGAVAGTGGLSVEPMPEIDFSQFGDIETQPLSKINKLTGKFLHRNWVNIPHVTQFDEIDITDLESFRKELNEEHKDKNIKITMVAFLIKAMASALKEFPRFNASLDTSGENLIMKKYINIGVAMDTPAGLVVPVIRDVECKSLLQIAQEVVDTSVRARDKKLTPSDMSGGCISISSLGGIGGTAFTPIVNAPEVAILGVSRAAMKPVYQDGEFVPRLMMPISLSYDHRVIDGAAGARFTTFLGKILADTRRLVL